MIKIDSSRGFVLRLFLSAAILKNASGQGIQISTKPRQFRDGDIILGGAIEIHRHASTGKCGELRAKGVQDVETINMLIDKLNANDTILRGIKLGTVLIDTCAWPRHAVKQIMTHILPFVHTFSTSSESEAILAGVLGAGTSRVSIQIANVLQAFEIPQISHSSTSQELSDKSLYPYFFRTVSPDWYQSRAMVQLAKEMGWNYISVVFENDCYGRNGYVEFSNLAKSQNVCIALSIPIPTVPTMEDYENISRQLLGQEKAKVRLWMGAVCWGSSCELATMLGVEGWPISGVGAEYNLAIALDWTPGVHATARKPMKWKMYGSVVYLNHDFFPVVIVYTTSTAAEKVISSTHRISGGRTRLIWVGSDGWATYLPKKSVDASYTNTLDGAVAFKPRGSHQESVDEYMTKITLEERQGEKFSVNPWFSELIALENKCSLEKDDNPKIRQCTPEEKLNARTFRSYDGLLNMVHAMEAFGISLDAYHRNVCNDTKGLCRAMSRQKGTNKLASGLYPFLKNVSFPVSVGGVFAFDENQDGPPSYDIVVYRTSQVENPELQRQGWTLAGKYTDGEISWIDVPPTKAAATESVCSKPCGIGEATLGDLTENCCWQCRSCSKKQFVDTDGGRCMDCAEGKMPNTNRTGCNPLPLRDIGYDEANIWIPLLLGILGILCTIVVGAVFGVYQKSPIIKASGREMCFFVLIGICLTFCNVFVLTARASLASCAISRFILAIGPAMMYAALLVKTIRIAIIFQYETNIPRRLETSTLPCWQIFISLGLTTLQLVILVIWSVIQTPHPTVLYDEDYGYLSCPGLSNEMIFIALVFPFILILICTVFATINRNVPTGFNETFLIGFTMYTTCVIWLAFLPLFLVNSSNIPLKMTTTSVCLNLCAFTVLGCLFGPRCYKVLFRPEENTKQAVMSNIKIFSMHSKAHGSTKVVSDQDMTMLKGRSAGSRNSIGPSRTALPSSVSQ